MSDSEFNLYNPQPLLIVISGPSGVGKDSVVMRMKERGLPFHFVVTATTRPQRANEIHGRDYFFVSKEEFARMIDEDDLIKRGCAIAAFAIAMSNVRPVIITPYVCLGSSRYTGRGTRNMLISWDISTQPLILSELMAVTRPEVTRHIGIEACRQLFGPIAQDDPSFHSDSFSEAKMRVHLNAKPDDLYLPSIHASDPILNNPVKWVNDQVNKYTSGEVTDLDTTPEDY